MDSCEVSLNKDALKLIDANEIVFVRKNGEMSIQLPQFDSNKTHKIYNNIQKYKDKKYTYSSGKFCIVLDKADEVFGKYLLEKEEDDIFLVKCEN